MPGYNECRSMYYNINICLLHSLACSAWRNLLNDQNIIYIYGSRYNGDRFIVHNY